MLQTSVDWRRCEHEALELKQLVTLNDVRTSLPCVLDHQDRKKRVCDLTHKVKGLKAHPEHWHVAALRKVVEDLREWESE